MPEATRGKSAVRQGSPSPRPEQRAPDGPEAGLGPDRLSLSGKCARWLSWEGWGGEGGKKPRQEVGTRGPGQQHAAGSMGGRGGLAWQRPGG